MFVGIDHYVLFQRDIEEGRDIHEALSKHRGAGLEPFSPNGEGALPVTTPWGSVEYCLRDPEGHIWGIVQAR